MKLRFSPTSPYVRKVMVSAIELGVAARIEKIPTKPWDADTDLPAYNPLGKVPALITDNNTFFDSPVICEYLDSLSDQATLFPSQGETRWQALRLQAMADGILDASVARLLEGKRAVDMQSQSWIARQHRVVQRALDALEQEAPAWGSDLTIGQVSVGCALGYVEFRFPDDQWPTGRSCLSGWYAEFSGRDSMQQTVPMDPPAQ